MTKTEGAPANVIESGGKSRWPMLPGGDWSTPHDARLWLKGEREHLGWSRQDIERRFRDTAYKSYLYLGVGGADCFDRPTLARIRRFEDGGEVIPDWLYWMPLAIARAAVTSDEIWEWDRSNIPENRDIREEQEEAELYSHMPYLEDDQLQLVARYNELPPHLQGVLRELAGLPDVIELISKHVATSDS